MPKIYEKPGVPVFKATGEDVTEVEAKGVRENKCIGCPSNVATVPKTQNEKLFTIRLHPFELNPATGMPWTKEEARDEVDRRAMAFRDSFALCRDHLIAFADAYVNLRRGGLTEEVIKDFVEHREEFREWLKVRNIAQAA